MDIFLLGQKVEVVHMRIAVLDSRAWIQHPIFQKHLPVIYQESGTTWMNRTEIVQKPSNPHGTAVCAIIAQHTSPNIKIHNFDIFHKEPQILTKKVISALKYIMDDGGYDIVNMSLGIRTPNTELEDLCYKISHQGTLIVSAFDNAGAISYPAAYPFVIGVDTSPRCTHAEDFVIVEDSPINIRGKGGVQSLAWVEPPYTISQGNSFAAPYVTAFIASHFTNGPSQEQALDFIRRNAKHIYFSQKSKNTTRKPFQISSASLFPYNKEMTSLISFRELLDFNIVEIFDTKYSGHIGLPVKGLYDVESCFNIKNIDDINSKAIDTLILGHISETEGVSGKAIKRDVLNKCLEKGLNVFAFDDLYLNEFLPLYEAKCLSLYCPNHNVIPVSNYFGKLYQMRSPVLCVAGTSKRQGKFTLQLQLRKKLTERQYIVGQLGSEPTAQLWGIDEVFPLGYNGIIESNVQDILVQTNMLMHKIDEKNPDIIIVGSQSNILPRAFYNTGQIPLSQVGYILGANPDAIILCVNLDDDIKMISRFIYGIQGLCNCRVIALGVYPFTYSNGWGIIRNKKSKASNESVEKVVQNLESTFKIPVIIVGEQEYEEKLVNTCIKFFTGDST